jgi:hypothetical protein
MIEGLRAGIAGAPLMQTKDPRSALAALAAQVDEKASSAFYRVDNLLSELSTVLSDSALQGRVNDYLAAVEQGPAAPARFRERSSSHCSTSN